MKRLFLLTIVVFCFSGCSWLPFLKDTPKAPTKAEEWLQYEKYTPIIAGRNGSDPFVVYDIERTFEAGRTETMPKKSWLQKLGISLTWTGGLILLVLAFFGSTPFVFVMRKYARIKTALAELEAEHGRTRSALKNTVVGISKMPPAAWAVAKEELSKSQNTEDKKMIDIVKSELHT